MCLFLTESQNLHQVLLTVIEGGVEIADPQGQKVCFAILRRLIELWAGKDGLAGFDEFVYKSIIPACFMAPMKPTFDLADAQTVLVGYNIGYYYHMYCLVSHVTYNPHVLGNE